MITPNMRANRRPRIVDSGVVSIGRMIEAITRRLELIIKAAVVAMRMTKAWLSTESVSILSLGLCSLCGVTYDMNRGKMNRVGSGKRSKGFLLMDQISLAYPIAVPRINELFVAILCIMTLQTEVIIRAVVLWQRPPT